MKPYLFLPLISLACISLTGCGLFPKTIPVDTAQIFVSAAIKEAMAESRELKSRPSRVTLSFYADEDVNAVTKVQKQQPVRNITPPPINPVQKSSASQDYAKTQLIIYNLQCELTKTVTFINCHMMDQTNQKFPDNVPKLNFKQITLRKNNGLSLFIQPSSDSPFSVSRATQYDFQCDRKDPKLYQNCKHLPVMSLNNVLSKETRFSLKEVRITSGNKFEMLVEQTQNKPHTVQQTKTYQVPAVMPLTAEKLEYSYIDPKPISFKVLMLRDNSLLLSADQESLNTDLKKTLGKNYIDHNDYVLTPGEFKFTDFTRIDADTRYLGFIVDYRDSRSAIWKKAFKVEPTGSTYPLFIHLKRNEVDIVTEEQ